MKRFMPRDYRVYLDDILEATARIRDFTAEHHSAESFVRDRKTFDAVIRNLEIIGEAAKNIPEEIRIKHPSIEWRKLIGLRNMLAHEYFGVNSDIIWDIVRSKIAIFEKQLRDITGQ